MAKDAAAKTWSLDDIGGKRYSANEAPGGGGALPAFYRDITFEFGSDGSSAVNDPLGFDSDNSIGGDTTISTTDPYSGTRCAQCHIDSAETLWGGSIVIPGTDIAVGDEVWVRARMKIPADFDAVSGDSVLKWLRWRTQNTGQVPNHSSTIALRANTITPLGIRTEQEDSSAVDDVNCEVPYGDWETGLWEFYIHLANDTTGKLGTWLNGEPQGWVDGVNTAGSGWVNLLIKFFDYWNNGAPSSQSVFVDRIQIATSRVESPANVDSDGHYFIGTA
jgi:hypothetical protein